MTIVVLGSINADLVCRVPHLPSRGETVRAAAVATHAGGKGANQATAVARLGAAVRLIGRVGDDSAGALLLTTLSTDGVEVSGVSVDEDAPTGTALITVDDAGETTIVTSGSANHRVGEEELAALREALAGASMLLMQLEIPIEVVVAAARLAREASVPVMLDPAPVRPLPGELLPLLDWITPNEQEAAALGRDLRVPHVVVTLGERGCRYSDGYSDDRGRELHVPAPRLASVDTVACGDAFNGALAVALTERRELRSALEFACAAGALAATQEGAGPSLPTRQRVEGLIDRGVL